MCAMTRAWRCRTVLIVGAFAIPGVAVAATDAEVTLSAQLVRATCMISGADQHRSIPLGTFLEADFAGAQRGPPLRDVTILFSQCGVGALETMSIKTSYAAYPGAPRLIANAGSASGIGLNVVYASTATPVEATRSATRLMDVAVPVYDASSSTATILLKANLLQASNAPVSAGSLVHNLLLEFSYP